MRRVLFAMVGVATLVAAPVAAGLAAPKSSLPAPYVLSSSTQNGKVLVLVASTAKAPGEVMDGQGTPDQGSLNEVSLLVVRDWHTGRTLWKRYMGGKVTVSPLKGTQDNLYAWSTVPGGHWEYVFRLTDGQLLNQIEVRHATPTLP